MTAVNRTRQRAAKAVAYDAYAHDADEPYADDPAEGADLGRPLRSRRDAYARRGRPGGRRLAAGAAAAAVIAASVALGLPAMGRLASAPGSDPGQEALARAVAAAPAPADPEAVRTAMDSLRQDMPRQDMPRQDMPRQDAASDRRVRSAALGEAPLGMPAFSMPDDSGPRPAGPAVASAAPAAAPQAAPVQLASVQVSPAQASPVPAAPAPSAIAASPSVTVTSNEVNAYLARARTALDSGDVAGARRLIERAAAGGSALALFSLAETFDPVKLAQWRVRGFRADPARARELYDRALAAGYEPARERIAGLR